MEGNQLPTDGPGLPDRKAAVEAARQAVSGLGTVLWRAGSAELGALLEEVDALGQACDASRATIVAEAVERGDFGSGPAAATLMQWLLHHAPSLRAGGARLVIDLAAAFRKEVNAPVRLAVESGDLSLRSAAVVIDECELLRPQLVEGADTPVMAALIALSQPSGTGIGMFEYRLRLDLEGKEALGAAVGPLSAPRPTDGEPDLRCSDRRRGDALLDVVQRGAAVAGSMPALAKAQLFVTVDYDTLRSRLSGAATSRSGRPFRAGTTVGGPGSGSLLAPETVRRLACDAATIPVVLGGAGQIMDWGETKRLFTGAQTARLWLRDQGCTYPGCTMPPQWTQAHHLVHWADFGPTDLDNAALLCRHHHTTVHSRRLAGMLVRGSTGAERVDWDLALGSYDQLLAKRAAQELA